MYLMIYLSVAAISGAGAFFGSFPIVFPPFSSSVSESTETPGHTSTFRPSTTAPITPTLPRRPLWTIGGINKSVLVQKRSVLMQKGSV